MKRFPFFVLFLSFFTIAASPSSTFKRPISFSVVVPPGKWNATRIVNVPKSAVIGIKVITNGELSVFFMSTDSYTRFPRQFRSLFQGTVDRQLFFMVNVPDAGNYYVVLMNRSSGEERAATITVGGSYERRHAQETLEQFQSDLDRMFIFKRFPIRMQKCGKPMAFATGRGVAICEEYARIVLEVLEDKTKARDTVRFALFHQVGHVLLEQWQLPGYEEEQIADEFATALLIILGQKARVRAMGEFFSSDLHLTKALDDTLLDKHSSFSDKRIKDILRWVEDPKVVHKWQAIFIPHMETNLLKQMRKTPPSWVDPDLLEKELANRG